MATTTGTPAEAVIPAPPAELTAQTAVQEEQNEPQSALTAAFTEAEWQAVREFRATLKDVFAEAYRDMPELQDATSIQLWGVTLDSANPVDARVSAVLIKFLRARYLNVQEAHTMMVATLRWREHFGVAAARKEVFPEEVFGKLGRLFGRDKAGRPVCYNLYGGHKDLNAVFGDVQRFLRWRIALMEKCVEQLDFVTVSQTLQIHDYEGVSMTSQDKNSKNAAAEATSIFQSHYPEMLARKYFINVPTILSWMFWLFKPLLSPQTLAKMSVVGSGRHEIKRTLLEAIDADELPRKYGGDKDGFE